MRANLVAGLLAVIFSAYSVADRTAYSQAEPELAKLLRGMAIIKASIALVASGLSLWRFGRAISPGAAIGYLVCVWSLGAATALIWCLSFIPIAAVIFHIGLFGVLVLAWREGIFEWRKRVV